MTKPLLILRAGDVVPSVAARRGEFEGLIRATVGDVWDGAWACIDVRDGHAGADLPDPRSPAAVIVTGSPSSVTERAPWMLRAEAYLRALADVEAPVLGICFGHQMLAQALGGEVVRNPRGREMGSVQLDVAKDDALFDGLGASFVVNATHVDSVARLPDAATVLATTALEPTAAFAYGPRIRGVQFHPEIDADAMRGYIRARAGAIAEEGADPDRMHDAVVETEANGQVLRNFVKHFAKRVAV